MSILTRLTDSLEIKINIILLGLGFERRIEHPELQVDALLELSYAKMETQNRAATGHLIDSLKFNRQLDILFIGLWESGLSRTSKCYQGHKYTN